MFNKVKKKNILYIFLITIIIYSILILLFNGFPTNTENEINKVVKGNKEIFSFTNICGDSYSNKECHELKIEKINKNEIKNQKDLILKEMVLNTTANQAISVMQNDELKHLYFFIADQQTHHNTIKIFNINKDNYELLKEISFFTFDKAYFGNYDEQKNAIYIGFIKTDFTERAFLSDVADSEYKLRYLFY